ncbi:conserved hypothetical protein, partial [Perkinsus marinus ATCC 50983]
MQPQDLLNGIDHTMLNHEQNRVYEFVEQLLLTSDEEGSLENAFILHGVGGTGKSFLIKCLVKLCLSKFGAGSCLVMAPTGKAASILPFGRTLHSALRLPVPLVESGFEPLAAESLTNFQDEMGNMRLVIIDELSMIGCRFLAAIDSRLKQARPSSSSKAFGGFPVILSGDYGQLPPVLDKPLFSEPNGHESMMCRQGRLAFSTIRRAFFLDEIVRTKERDFQSLLLRVRDGVQTPEDLTVVLARQLHRLPAIERQKFQASILLCSTRGRAAEVNEEYLHREPGGSVVLTATHSGRGAASHSDELAKGLLPRVELKIGSPVMLTANLGKVFGVFASDAHDNLPVVLVDFPDYEGPPLNPNFPTVVPIPAVTRTWHNDGRVYSRTQAPLVLAYATTIYKSQGSSLSCYTIDFGSKEI